MDKLKFFDLEVTVEFSARDLDKMGICHNNKPVIDTIPCILQWATDVEATKQKLKERYQRAYPTSIVKVVERPRPDLIERLQKEEAPYDFKKRFGKNPFKVTIE